MNDLAKSLAIWAVIAVLLLSVFFGFSGPRVKDESIRYSTFIEMVHSGRVKKVDIIDQGSGYNIEGLASDGKAFRSFGPYDNGLINDLIKYDVDYGAVQRPGRSVFVELVLSLVPILLLMGMIYFFVRQMQNGPGGRGAMSFGRSRARLQGEDQVKVTFADVAGVDEAKEDVKELVDFLRDPQKFQRLGGRIPRGVLMVGPPGTGKTLLARAIAGEAKVPFFTISGSDFVEMFVGVGASRVRDMFEQAKRHAPCIIFIDEIDAVGRHRGAGLGGGHDEREQTNCWWKWMALRAAKA
jgi:cell division protease FtsH